MSSSNLISVIIPAYNHERYIAETVRSVLEQTYQDFELIIINDGSNDGTDGIIRQIDDDRIRYLSRENRGAHNTINEGIALASGEYVSILNSDDLYAPDRLERCVSLLRDDPDCAGIITGVNGIDDDGIPVTVETSPNVAAWLEWYDHATSYIDHNGMYYGCLAYNLLITTSNYFLRSSVFEDVGVFRALRYAHDWDLLLRATRAHDIRVLPDALLSYRIHAANTVHENESNPKVRYEVNWLVQECIRSMPDRDLVSVRAALAENHYIDHEVMLMLLLFRDDDAPELLLDMQCDVARELLQVLA